MSLIRLSVPFRRGVVGRVVCRNRLHKVLSARGWNQLPTQAWVPPRGSRDFAAYCENWGTPVRGISEGAVSALGEVMRVLFPSQ
jgi:hypothetical protein